MIIEPNDALLIKDLQLLKSYRVASLAREGSSIIFNLSCTEMSIGLKGNYPCCGKMQIMKKGDIFVYKRLSCHKCKNKKIIDATQDEPAAAIFSTEEVIPVAA